MYLIWNKQTITDFSDSNINSLYNEGYLFGRTGKGEVYQTRSVRIDLEKFKLSSENKRILKKTENIKLSASPIPYPNYHWSVHKMGKDFYEHKFGSSVFSANKIKELMTDEKKSNFNLVLKFGIGYCIAFQTPKIFHYSYPFYDSSNSPKDNGLGMMLRAILWAKENGKKYVYLGSASRPTDTYKLQFAGVEWFDGKAWKSDLNELKKILKT